jgi:VanZ family protein
MTRTQIIAFRIAFFLVVVAITYLAITRQEFPVVKDVSDKANHILAFYVLTWLLDFSFPQKGLGLSKIFALLSYGLLIEIIQSFLPNRTPSSLDLFADGVGIALYKLSLPVLRRVPVLSRRWRVQASS